MGGVSVLTMSFFTAIGIEDTVLLTVILIEVALLLVLLLIGLINSTTATRSYISAFLVFAVLLFLFLQDQLYGINEPAIETSLQSKRSTLLNNDTPKQQRESSGPPSAPAKEAEVRTTSSLWHFYLVKRQPPRRYQAPTIHKHKST